MYCKRILAVLSLLCAVNGYAFKVQYGNFFTIERVRVKQDVLVLPLTRGKYEDIRIINKDTFEFVKNCAPLTEKEICKQDVDEFTLRVGEIIPLRDERGKRLVSVIVNEAWLIEVVAELQAQHYKFKFPSAFSFWQDKAPKKRKEKTVTDFEKQFTDFVAHKLEQEQNHEM